MNYNYIKSVLVGALGSSQELYEKRVQGLIDDIEAYQKQENLVETTHTIMRTVDEYVLSYLSLMDEFNSIPEEKITKRMNKVSEILCTLSGIHTYLMLTLSEYSADNSNAPSEMYKVLQTLNKKLEHYKSEKFVWVPILNGLTQESKKLVELAKMKMYSSRV